MTTMLATSLTKDYGWKELSVLPQTLLVEDYALVLPSSSPLREPLSRALLHLIHSPAWKATGQRYSEAGE